VRDRRSTVIWKRYCGTVAKAGGNRENKLLPVVTEGSCLLENKACENQVKVEVKVMAQENMIN
jgi:hypothetical protein